ncbi:hypothetical protein [Paractinoplanes toevensis]|uniref:Uncharacterized protein n=1 Tax=Paractinoplanes toevensis TaxID=571911 RepID=A0A919W5A4_9ACTN|nr:hypothetical protein [Actinoplanes toevensis]GIM91053.1 hypothetical protein Ato02nite_028460 [Actinoplanes toevensis]
MGLAAYVHCGCWAGGLAGPPPAGPIGFGADGRLGLLEPWTAETEEAHFAVEDWLQNGCAHERMQLISEYLGSGAGHLRRALLEAGGANFPALLAYLPTRTHDGCIPAGEVPRVLAELDLFEKEARLPDEAVLVDEASGTVLFSRGFDVGRYFIGVDEDGFFVRDTRVDPPVELFRATRFEQQALPGDELELSGDGRTVRLSSRKPFADFLPTTPRRLVAEVRSRTGADFAHLLGMLRRLGAASVTTGSPVTWT